MISGSNSTLRRPSLCVGLVLGISIPALVASANLVVLDQSRSITARAMVGDQTDGPFSIMADPFVLFDEGVAAGAASLLGASGAAANQLSEFRSDRIVAQGGVSATASGDGPFDTAATSLFDLTFSVETTTEVTVLRSLSGTGVFEFLQGNTLLLSGSGVDDLMLQAGTTYRVVIAAGASLDDAGNEGGGYALQLIGVPAPGPMAALGLAGLVAARRRRERHR